MLRVEVVVVPVADVPEPRMYGNSIQTNTEPTTTDTAIIIIPFGVSSSMLITRKWVKNYLKRCRVPVDRKLACIIYFPLPISIAFTAG